MLKYAYSLLPNKMKDPSLKFLANDAGEKEGLADAGIESFRDEPYASCAREAGQNSRDAAIGEQGVPVKMSFNHIMIDRNSLPSYNSLKDAIDECKAKASKEREVDFFNNASGIIENEEISVLEISDFNTLGLLGPPDEEETPFHSLVKSSGVTAKNSENSGGSYGIGKNASFAVSDLHTVFYSTLYVNRDTGKTEFAAQGKVKLVSHTDKSGQKVRATGYWGYPEGFSAVRDPEKVPNWMIRDCVGTSIFCIGFRAVDGWAERITYSLVSNFFCAVHREEIEFDVANGSININRNTLLSLLTRPDIVEASERTGHYADLHFAQQMYQCLVSEKADEHTLKIPNLGEVRIRILIAEGLPCRVGFIRNGMLITDNLKHFGDAFARFPGSRDFVVLVEPADIDAGVFLKNIENPTHDDFSAERITNLNKRSLANDAMKRLGRELRKIIKTSTGVKHEGAVILDELGKFFAEPKKAENSSLIGAESDPERYTYTPQRPKPKGPACPTPTGGEQDASIRTRTRSAGASDRGNESTIGRSSSGKGSNGERMPVVLSDVRNRIPDNASSLAISRELHFSPKVAGTIQVMIQATGIDAPDSLNVIHSDKGSVYRGMLIIKAKEGERCNPTVFFDEPYGGPIELIAVSQTESSEAKA